MFGVETYAAVRRFVIVEGRSRRGAARVFGLSRDTVAKMCRFSPPGYVRSKLAEKPKLGALIPVIEAILEGNRPAPAKQQRGTAWSASGSPLLGRKILRGSRFVTSAVLDTESPITPEIINGLKKVLRAVGWDQEFTDLLFSRMFNGDRDERVLFLPHLQSLARSEPGLRPRLNTRGVTDRLRTDLSHQSKTPPMPGKDD